MIARALARDTPVLMADEGRAALVSIRDLGLAARHCTRLILLAEGGVWADGLLAGVLTPDLMARAFGISIWHQHTDQGAVLQPLEVVR